MIAAAWSTVDTRIGEGFDFVFSQHRRCHKKGLGEDAVHHRVALFFPFTSKLDSPNGPR